MWKKQNGDDIREQKGGIREQEWWQWFTNGVPPLHSVVPRRIAVVHVHCPAPRSKKGCLLGCLRHTSPIPRADKGAVLDLCAL